MYYFLQGFSYVLKFWLQNYFDMCFEILIKCITSLLYGACSIISTHLYLFNDMSIYLPKEKKKKPKHLKPIYL